MNLIDEEGLRALLSRSTAIGTEVEPMFGEERILWRTDEGEEFRTSYEDAALHGRKLP